MVSDLGQAVKATVQLKKFLQLLLVKCDDMSANASH